jgi:hypothetical protein
MIRQQHHFCPVYRVNSFTKYMTPQILNWLDTDMDKRDACPTGVSN